MGSQQQKGKRGPSRSAEWIRAAGGQSPSRGLISPCFLLLPVQLDPLRSWLIAACHADDGDLDFKLEIWGEEGRFLSFECRRRPTLSLLSLSRGSLFLSLSLLFSLSLFRPRSSQ